MRGNSSDIGYMVGLQLLSNSGVPIQGLPVTQKHLEFLLRIASSFYGISSGERDHFYFIGAMAELDGPTVGQALIILICNNA
jgi:hypothetical protein